MAVDADEVFQGGPFIQLAAAALEPGEIGVPAQGRDGDPQALDFRLRSRLRSRSARRHGGDGDQQPDDTPEPHHTAVVHPPLHTDLLCLAFRFHTTVRTWSDQRYTLLTHRTTTDRAFPVYTPS